MNIAKLFELQKIDVAMEKTRRRLAQIKQAMGESPELVAARSAVAATESELHQAHAAQKDAELETQSLNERIHSTETQLMSGKVRNPKELESLQANLEAMKRQRSTVEESGMEALLRVEALSKTLDEQGQRLASVENGWNNGQAELGQDEKKLKRSYVQLKQQREELTQTIDSESLDYYEQIRTRKGGVAVAPVQNGQCGVCHIQVPTGVQSAVRARKTEAVLCPSCGRILFAG